MTPVSPAMAENLAQEVVAMYADSERILLERIARALAKGIDAPYWAEHKLLEIQFLSVQTQRLVADLGDRAAAQVAVDLAKAYNRGGASAANDLASILKVPLSEASAPILSLPPVELLVSETMRYLSATGTRILRSTMDAYRSVVAETAGQVLIGTQTRRQAAQSALNRFAVKGITGFIDKAGRGWNLPSYVEMAMRTGCGRAVVKGAMDRLQSNGLDLVIVSDAPGECELCRPFEGQVFSLSGSSPDYPPLDSAEADGLFHVNCRHQVSAYQEDVTRPMGEVADPEGYAASQKLRYLERQTRSAKRLEAAALDDDARKAAQARVAAYQQKIRDHVNTTGAKRLRYREQLGVI